MIIFEGPDGAGKTTLINRLFEKGGPLNKPPYIRFRGDDHARDRMAETVKTRYATAFSAVLKALPHEIVYVFDRLFFSELCYGRYLRGGHILSDQQLRMYWQLIQNFPALVVVCLPTEGVSGLRLEGHHQELIDRMPEITRWYQALGRGYLNPGWCIQVDPFYQDQAVELISHKLKEWSEAWQLTRSV